MLASLVNLLLALIFKTDHAQCTATAGSRMLASMDAADGRNHFEHGSKQTAVIATIGNGTKLAMLRTAKNNAPPCFASLLQHSLVLFKSQFSAVCVADGQ